MAIFITILERIIKDMLFLLINSFLFMSALTQSLSLERVVVGETTPGYRRTLTTRGGRCLTFDEPPWLISKPAHLAVRSFWRENSMSLISPGLIRYPSRLLPRRQRLSDDTLKVRKYECGTLFIVNVDSWECIVLIPVK